MRKKPIHGKIYKNNMKIIKIFIILIGLFFISIAFYTRMKYSWRYFLYNDPDGSGRTHRSVAAALEKLSYFQSIFKDKKIIDQDSDGIGEYASAEELSGINLSRISRRVNFPMMTIMKNENRDVYNFNGCYYIKLYFPGKSFSKRDEIKITSDLINLQEHFWVAIAWPGKQCRLGYCVFITGQEKKFYCCKNDVYKFRGLTNIPKFENLIPNWTGNKAQDYEIAKMIKVLSKKEEWFMRSN